MNLYSNTFYAEELKPLFSAGQYVSYMLMVENSLAKAQAKFNIIPTDSAVTIAECCQVQYIDLDKIQQEIQLGGNAALPLVQQLTRIVKNQQFDASKYVHLGATSQDVVDTATVLLIKDFMFWMENQLNRLIEAVITLTRTHRNTLMIGRTLLQQASPITFGLKTSGWLNSLLHTQQMIEGCKSRVLKIQMFGAVGSGNQYLTKEVVDDLAVSLGLFVCSSWQSNRASIAEWAGILGILNGAMSKIAKDISLLMQTEVGEVSEGGIEGKGLSSTMPHKRNPVSCALILANAVRTPHLVATLFSAMTQEHERSAGLWHAEWEVLTQLMALTGGSLMHSIDLLKNLDVNEKRMASNLNFTNGLIYAEQVALALVPTLGKTQANALIQKACKISIREHKHLKEVLKDQFDATKVLLLDDLFLPENSIGNSLQIIDAILNGYESNRP